MHTIQLLRNMLSLAFDKILFIRGFIQEEKEKEKQMLRIKVDRIEQTVSWMFGVKCKNEVPISNQNLIN